VVHGASGTGQTVFVEPFETVETNNQLVQLAEDEAAEIFRILKELTDRLREMHGPLQAAAETIAELDSVSRGRGLRGISMRACRSFPPLRIAAGRRAAPVLEDKLRKEHRAIVRFRWP